MPQLGLLKTNRLFLPSTADPKIPDADKAWVDVVDKLLLGAIADISKLTDPVDQSIMGLTHFIKDWNFTGEDGAKSAITADNIRELDMQDFEFLATAFAKAMESAESGLSVEEKKASSATSTAAETSTPQQISVTTD